MLGCGVLLREELEKASVRRGPFSRDSDDEK